MNCLSTPKSIILGYYIGNSVYRDKNLKGQQSY